MARPMGKTPRSRLDLTLVERGIADTRSKAQALIMAGDVQVNGVIAGHAGDAVAAADAITLRAKPRFVSRGGEKLDHALAMFGIDVAGMIAVDLGASTGGFTDCLLQRGAARVYAIDVGYGQLAQSLRDDPRVINREKTNARTLEKLPELADIVVIDASFISLKLLLPTADRLSREAAICVPLVKPQFEAGRADVGKGGVVRSDAVRGRVIEETIAAGELLGYGVHGVVVSPLRGPAGNAEFLLWMVRGAANELLPDAVTMVVGEASR